MATSLWTIGPLVLTLSTLYPLWIRFAYGFKIPFKKLSTDFTALIIIITLFILI